MIDLKKWSKEIVPTRYASYVNLMDASTEGTVMLAELIDNAISSKEQNEGLNINRWNKPLRILIQLEVFSNAKKSRRVIKLFKEEEIKIVQGTKLIVLDNAYGISKTRIKDALTLDKKNPNSKSKMNRHGRGLKQSAFWWGVDLIVVTKTKEGEYYKTKLCLTEQLDKGGLDAEVRIIPEDLTPSEKVKSEKGFSTLEKKKDGTVDYNESGTRITIRNLHSGSTRCLTKKQFEIIINNLALRYKRYIEKNDKFSIKVSFIDNNDKSKLKQDLFDLKHKYDNNLKLFQTNIPKIRDFLLAYNTHVSNIREKKALTNIKNDFENRFDSEIKSIKNDCHNKGINIEDQIHILNLCTEFKQWILAQIHYCNKFGEKYEEKFSKSFFLKFPESYEKKPLKIKIWALHTIGKEEADKRGFWIYEGNRAIHHPTKWAWNHWMRGQLSRPTSHSTINRFGGEFSMDNLGIHSSHDKTKIIWNDDHLKKYLATTLYSLWRIFDIITQKAREERKKEPPSLEGKDIKKIKQSLEEYDKNMNACFNHTIEVNTKFISYDDHLTGFVTKILYKDTEFEIEFKLNYKEIDINEGILVSDDEDNDNKKITFTVNLENPYFKKMSVDRNDIEFYINLILQPFTLVAWNIHLMWKNNFSSIDSKNVTKLFSTSIADIDEIK